MMSPFPSFPSLRDIFLVCVNFAFIFFSNFPIAKSLRLAYKIKSRLNKYLWDETVVGISNLLTLFLKFSDSITFIQYTIEIKTNSRSVLIQTCTKLLQSIERLVWMLISGKTKVTLNTFLSLVKRNSLKGRQGFQCSLDQK